MVDELHVVWCKQWIGPDVAYYSVCLVFSWVPQLEYTARLDFLWRVQAKEEINEMKELREHNENMLRNILPSHVARHFLEKDRDNEVWDAFPSVFLF